MVTASFVMALIIKIIYWGKYCGISNHKKRKDKWNALIGENWGINKYWSWSFEVGLAGS